jgi:hypothetical protein
MSFLSVLASIFVANKNKFGFFRLISWAIAWALLAIAVK